MIVCLKYTDQWEFLDHLFMKSCNPLGSFINCRDCSLIVGTVHYTIIYYNYIIIIGEFKNKFAWQTESSLLGGVQLFTFINFHEPV